MAKELLRFLFCWLTAERLQRLKYHLTKIVFANLLNEVNCRGTKQQFISYN